MFAIFIDDIVDTVRRTNVGCYVNFICCAIFLYADDIVLLAPSVTGLQFLLTTCERYLSEIDMNINVSKSTCIRFGPRFSNVCEKLRLCNGDQLEWSVRCKYLGVHLVSSTSFRVLFDIAKGRFFRSWNAIFSKVGRTASEEVVISLLRHKCLPILLYGTESCPLFARDKHSFEFSVTKIFMKLFRTNSSPIVKECQKAFRFLPIANLIDIRTAAFLERYMATDNVACDLFFIGAADHLRRLAGLYGLREASSHLIKTKCYSDL